MAIVRGIPGLGEDEKVAVPLQLPLADPLGNEIMTRFFNVFTSPDSRHTAGTWESDPGRSRWEFGTDGEIIYVLGGSMIVTRDGEDALKLGAGDLAVFEPGWQGFWEVTEPLSKVYVTYR